MSLLAIAWCACTPSEPPRAATPPPLEGQWAVTWTRPTWSPKVFTGRMDLRARDDGWTGVMRFDQSTGEWGLQSLTEGDPLEITFDDALTLSLSLEGSTLTGTASMPRVGEAMPFRATRGRRPAVLPGVALVPHAPPSVPSTTLSPYEDPRTITSARSWALSGDGHAVWTRRYEDGRLVFEVGMPPAVERRFDGGTHPTRWWWPSHDGQRAVTVNRWGGVTEVGPQTRSLASVQGTVRWAEPRWGDRDVVILAVTPPEGGVQVVDVAIDDGAVHTLAEHPTAHDVVLNADLTPRRWFTVARQNLGRGVSRDLWTPLEPAGPPLHQPTWVRDRGPRPRISDGPLHMLAGPDLAGWVTMTATGLRTHPLPGAWADATDLLMSRDGQVHAVGWTAERLHWAPHTPTGRDLVWLTEELHGDVRVQSQSHDDQQWIVSLFDGATQRRHVHVDRTTRTLTPLSPRTLPRHGVSQALVVNARDDRKLAAILTTPRQGTGPWPLVVHVHGGPWAGRHHWAPDQRTERWAERGYATLQVNFRGTHGFGWHLTHGPEAEFGDAPMIDDLEDGITWAVEAGHADPERIAMVGASYGGYAALRFATAEAPRLRCAVAGLVRGNLTVPGGGLNIRSVGTPAWRRAHSPDRFTERLTHPVLVWNGGLDGDNPDAIRDFVTRAQDHGKPVTWVRFPWERHGLTTAVHREAMAVLEDRFLSACLGGPAWPFPASFAEADLEVRAGVAGVPGLRDVVR